MAHTLPTYPCPHVRAEFAVDGDLGKQAWAGAPRHKLAPTAAADSGQVVQPTIFRACWTDSHVFFAFQCTDRDIWSTYTHRDDPLYNEEVVEAFLSPTGDLRHYYEFEVSPRNVIFDAKVTSPELRRQTMTVDTKWDCPGIRTAVRVDGTLDDRQDTDRGWTVEIAIPFAAFPEAGAPKPGSEWRANFYRIDMANPPEFTAWSPTLENPPNFHVPARFGHLRFVKG